MLQHLLRPFAYLRINHPLKWKVDWFFPLVLAVITIALIIFLRRYGLISLYSETGLISKILSFVQTLPGFYIAALAAIATFNKIDIDQTMPAPAPKMDIVIQGRSIEITLTRRRFLCAMFAFLTAESLVIIVAAIAAITFTIPLRSLVPAGLHIYVSYGFFFSFAILFWQMVVASFLGLYYLGERLHQPDPLS
jgi:hypothetical protein